MKVHRIVGLVTILAIQILALPAQAACDSETLSKKFVTYLEQVEPLLDSNDKGQVLSFVNGYPEGTAPPGATLVDNSYQVQIPSRAAAYYLAGVEALAQGNKLVAAWAFLEAAKRNPGRADFLNNVAFIALQYGLYAEAKEILLCARSLESKLTSVHVNLGMAYAGLGQYGEAGSSFLNSILLDPVNSDYFVLGAAAYAQAGRADMAWLLGTLGQNAFGQQQSLTTILNGITFPPAAQQCTVPVPPPLPGGPFWNLRLTDWTDEIFRWTQWDGSYQASTLDPANMAAEQGRSACIFKVQQAAAKCTDQGVPAAVCQCRYDPLLLMCDLGQDLSYLEAHSVYFSALSSRTGVMIGNMTAALNASKDQLTASEFASLSCELEENRRNFTSAVVQDASASLGNILGWVQSDRRNIAGLLAFCSKVPYEVWIYTGQITGSLEPAYCIGFVCISYDQNTNMSISIALGPAIKLSKNALTGNWGLSLGVGVQFGVGPIQAGGALMMKFGQGKVGAEAKVTAGPFDLGYQLTAEQLSVSPLTPLPVGVGP